jgi:hypothetical protein
VLSSTLNRSTNGAQELPGDDKAEKAATTGLDATLLHAAFGHAIVNARDGYWQAGFHTGPAGAMRLETGS